MGPQAIFNPRILDGPLSITTVPNGPYADTFSSGLLRYAYRGTDPSHPDNRGLRTTMARKVPLVYLFGLVPGRYLAVWPVFVVGDSQQDLFFDVAVDDIPFGLQPQNEVAVSEERDAIRREYVTATVRRRLHQQAFRSRVLAAYRSQCSLCRLRHEELLDAAHIVGDALPQGEPLVSNGLALCKLHHAAFDEHFLAVRPDYVIEVRQSILDEEDGPMLRHGLQGMTCEKSLCQRPLRSGRTRCVSKSATSCSAD
jgi:putative restriction endonuclease